MSMGVYIRGMEMPKERESFTLTIKYNGLVFDTETGIQVAEAQEVPHHGRLIDADALKWNYIRIRDDGIKEFSQYGIDRAPTIIPAIEEDET